MRFINWFRKKRQTSGKTIPDTATAKPMQPEKRLLETLFSPVEWTRANAMAAKAAAWQPFADACRKHGYQNLTRAFLEFYAGVKDNPATWKMEAETEEKVETKGKRFSRTGFYAKLFIDIMEKEALQK